MENYLRRWLDPWSEGRARRGDYRILMMDVAASHLSPELVGLAWSRGYCVLFHYGCTTAIAQVNDTHCHSDYSAIFCELELASMVEQRLFDPGNIGRTLQQVLDDAAAAWRALPHDRGAMGHLHDGLSNALDGSEDDWVGGDALLFWRDAGMREERLRAIAEVDELVSTEKITGFDQWQELIRHPADPGAKALDGEEFEGELCEGERVWLEPEEAAALWAEEAEILALAAVEETTSAAGGALADAPSPEEVAQARRLAKMKETLADLRGLGVPAAANLISKQVESLEKSARCGGKEDQARASNKLRAFVGKSLDKERKLLQARQKDSLRKRKIAAQVLKKNKQAKQKKAFAAKAKAALKAKIAKLPKTFTAAMCGEAGAKGLAARVLCLERLKLHSPELDFERQHSWDFLKGEIAKEKFFFKCVGLSAKASIGHAFVEEIDKVTKSLKEFYLGPSLPKKKGEKGGEPDGFVKFFDKFMSFVPKCATSVVL